MEKQLNISGEFCACNGSQPIYKYTYADDGILRSPKDADVEVCQLCGRAVNKTVIIVDYVKPEKPDWMTDEQYNAAYS